MARVYSLSLDELALVCQTDQQEAIAHWGRNSHKSRGHFFLSGASPSGCGGRAPPAEFGRAGTPRRPPGETHVRSSLDLRRPHSRGRVDLCTNTFAVPRSCRCCRLKATEHLQCCVTPPLGLSVMSGNQSLARAGELLRSDMDEMSFYSPLARSSPPSLALVCILMNGASSAKIDGCRLADVLTCC